MADKALSALTAATLPFDGTELFYTVKSGNSRQGTIADVWYGAAAGFYDNTDSGLAATTIQDAIDELSLAGLGDGDKGDITVSSFGASWTIDNDAVTNAKLANMAQATFKGRAAGAGTGDPSDLSAAQAVAIIGDTDGTLAANSDSVVATQKATKSYVDGQVAAVSLALAGVAKRATVRVKTTANITISTALNNGDTIDGVTLATDDLVLVGSQSATEENGVYVVGVSPARSAQFDTYNEHPGAVITVQEGTANADTLWLCTSNIGGTLDTDPIVFTAINIAAAVYASTTDVLNGSSTTSSVTPDALAALWEKGADIASAGTISVGEGGYFHVTGTTGITDIDWAVATDGRPAYLVFDGALTITHHSTTLILPDGVDIITAAGDSGLFVQDSGDNVKCVGFWRKNGTRVKIGGYVGGAVLTSSEEVFGTIIAGRSVKFPAGLTGSQAKAGAASTGTAVLDINKNGSGVGTITFTTSATGVLAMASATTFAAGDVLTVVGPASADATLKQISFTLVGDYA